MLESDGTRISISVSWSNGVIMPGQRDDRDIFIVSGANGFGDIC
jgi:hypothetical protein